MSKVRKASVRNRFEYCVCNLMNCESYAETPAQDDERSVDPMRGKSTPHQLLNGRFDSSKARYAKMRDGMLIVPITWRVEDGDSAVEYCWIGAEER